METKEFVIIQALEEFANSYLGKFIDHTKNYLQVFADNPAILAQYQEEYADRLALRNYVLDLAEEIQSRSGTWIIDDGKTPENANLLRTMEEL
jgi:hypothetical protein